jgi:putative ABC transport system permease protein
MLHLALRILAHEKKRSCLAIGGILVATLLIFLQLGFYGSVSAGGTVFYDVLRFDMAITASDYVSQGQSNEIPRRRIYQAMAMPEVQRVAAVYEGKVKWVNDAAGKVRDIFVIGFNPSEDIFDVPEVEAQLQTLSRTDTILVDRGSRAELGSLEPDRSVEINQRTVVIGGNYSVGTGFLALGAALVSDLNFIRIFRDRSLSQVNLGLIKLKPGEDAEQVAKRLQQILPEDTRVWTRAEFMNHESSHWSNRTSAGLIFGFGVFVALIVGLAILYQTLATQIARQLPQFATLKAMGYTNRHLLGVVIVLAFGLTTVAYFPAAALATGIYAFMRRVTILPMEMDTARLIFVFLAVLAMSIVSAMFCMRVLHRADPVDLF